MRMTRLSGGAACLRCWVLTLAIWGGFWDAACQKGPRLRAYPGSNVLLITLDTTRADRLGGYGYARARTPNLDRLAAEGVRFNHAYAEVPLTLPSHASIMTGTGPLVHQVRNNGSYNLPPPALTLAEVFKSHGYETAAFVASFTVDSRFGLDQGFNLYDDTFGDPAIIKGVYSERRADEVFRVFSAWFSKNGGRKFFIWLHFYDPHMPYDPPEPFKSEPGLDSYDGEIANVDLYLGKVLEALEREPSVRLNTLVAVVGDHGEAFGEHGEFGHGMFCYEESLLVPFLLSAPGRLPAHRVVSGRVGLIDLYPTILDHCGIEIPPSSHGVSLLPAIRSGLADKRSLYFESYFPLEHIGGAPITGAIIGDDKYIEVPRPELYELDKDPLEKRNVISEKTAKAELLKRALADLKNKDEGTALEAGRKMTSEEKRRLESLGYVSLQPGATAGSGLADPKDLIVGWTAFSRALAWKQTGSLNEAKSALREAIALVPGLIGPYIHLGELLFAERDYASLVSTLEEGLRQHPQSGELRIRLAYYLVLLGKTAAALDQLRAAEPVVEFGQREQYFDTLGMAWGTAGDFARAAEAYGKAVEIEPANADAVRKQAYSLFRLGRAEDALAGFRRAERLSPDNPVLLEEMGRFFAAGKDYEQAEIYFQKALQHPEPPPLAFFNYAVLLSEKGELSRAIETMERYLALSGPDSRLKAKAKQWLAVWRRG